MLLKMKRWITRPSGVVLAIILILLVVPTVTQPVSAQTVVATVTVGNNPQGVAVNPSTNRIYVVNAFFDNTVSVIDGATNTVVATVPVGNSPWDVAVNPSTNRIYVANAVDFAGTGGLDVDPLMTGSA